MKPVWKMLQEETETEMRRLKLELKQTMEMYSEACKEAVVAKERERQQVCFTPSQTDTPYSKKEAMGSLKKIVRGRAAVLPNSLITPQIAN